jgi:kynurenine formamidase
MESPRSEETSASKTIDLATARLVDLSHSYDESTIYWPTSPSRFEAEMLFEGESEGGYFYSAKSFCTPEHGGTHLDAPYHFAAGSQTVEEIPLERLVGPAVVIDVSAQALEDPDYRLTAEDISRWETEHGRIPEGAIVLLRSDWSKRWPDAQSYYGSSLESGASDLHFPAFGEEAARLLIEKRLVGVLGLDTASLDHGPSTDFIVHRVAGGANVPGLENLTNLDQVPAVGAWVFALPMKIGGGTGAPVRVVAVLPG